MLSVVEEGAQFKTVYRQFKLLGPPANRSTSKPLRTGHSLTLSVEAVTLAGPLFRERVSVSGPTSRSNRAGLTLCPGAVTGLEQQNS